MIPFAELLSIPLPELAQQSMRPVKVAVLDTGIDASHEAFKGKIVRAFGYRRNQSGEVERVSLDKAANNDPSGHGTGAAAIIGTLAPNVRFIDYRVLDADNGGYGYTVVRGLEDAIGSDADIINMSVAYRKDKYWEQTAQLLEMAYRRNKIVVAAKRNLPLPGDLGLPAELSNAISVDIGDYRNPYLFKYLKNSPIEFSANGVSVLTARTGGGYVRMTGSSFATPTIAAFCALLRGVNAELKLFEIKTLLKNYATLSRSNSCHIVNPLEIAPETYDSRYQLVEFVCRKCGQKMEVPDAFPKVKCEKCGRVSRREVLLEPSLYCRILNELRVSVPREFCFHNWMHTREVVEAVYRILRKFPSLSARRKRCLLLAALMHDFGYLVDPSNHEAASARMASEICKSIGIAEKDVESITAIILATNPARHPVTLEEKIIRDADLYHMKSSARQREKAQLLRQELKNCGKVYSDAEWRRLDRTFRKVHKFNVV